MGPAQGKGVQELKVKVKVKVKVEVETEPEVKAESEPDPEPGAGWRGAQEARRKNFRCRHQDSNSRLWGGNPQL